MEKQNISTDFPFTLKRVQVYDAEMAYIETVPDVPQKDNKVIVFLHGNPTSSYLWRNIIPHVAQDARCLAPDLIGMGSSSKLPHLAYRFVEHAMYLDEFLQTMVRPSERVILVLHDWGSALGLHWARRNSDKVAGLVLMEFILPVPSLAEFAKHPVGQLFESFRGPEEVGRKLIIEDNMFIEELLPRGVARGLTEHEMHHYRAPFLDPASREPIYRWPNEIPIENNPADVFAVAQKYRDWLFETELPKLFFWATPGGIINEDFASWLGTKLKNVRKVHSGDGLHYLQEDSPHLIGKEIREWTEDIVQ